MVKVVWASNALDDLQSLIEYIERDAPVAARRLAQRIIDRVERLAMHPYLGAYLAEDDTQTYRELYQGSYRILYRATDEKVYIVAIRHAARLLRVDDLE